MSSIHPLCVLEHKKQGEIADRKEKEKRDGVRHALEKVIEMKAQIYISVTQMYSIWPVPLCIQLFC